MPRRAVVLLSGGLDSTCCAAWARAEGFAVHALTVDYGQRHRIELDAARRVADALGVERHVVLSIDLAAFGGSALTDAAIAVPKEGVRPGIPVTYVPARNTVLLGLALACAEAAGAADIVIGVNAVDYSGYPDCRPAFIAAFEALARLGTRAGAEEGGALRIHAPLIALSKADIIRLAAGVDAPLHLSWSCYDPVEGRPCGACDSCRIRAAGFAEAGLADPASRQ